MPEWLSNFLINLALMLMAIWSIMELIYDKSQVGNFIKKIKPRGRFLISCAIVVLFVNLFKDCNNEHKLRDASKLQLKTDSQNKIDIVKAVSKADSTNYTDVINALAKYHLRYDSGQKNIEKLIKDSSKKVVNNFVADTEPSFNLCIGREVKDYPGIRIKHINQQYDSLYISFCSMQNNACNINLSIYIIIPKIKQDTILEASIMYKNFNNPNGVASTTNTLLDYGLEGVEIIYFKFLGTYSNCGKPNEIILNSLYRYHLDQNSYDSPTPSVVDKINLFLSKHNEEARRFFKRHKL